MDTPKLNFSNLCDIIVNNNPDITNGIYCHCITENEEFNYQKCIICTKLLTQYDNLLNHQTNQHTNVNSHQCSNCTKTFSQSHNLLTHQTTLHNYGTQSCNEIIDKSELDIFYSSFESNNESDIYMSDSSFSPNISTSQDLNKICDQYCLEDSKADYYNISIDIPLAREDNPNSDTHNSMFKNILNSKLSDKIPKIIRMTCNPNEVNIKIKSSKKYFNVIAVSYKSFRNSFNNFMKLPKKSIIKYKKTYKITKNSKKNLKKWKN